MPDRRFTVVLTPEGVEMREDPQGRYSDLGEAFRAGKRMAGWHAAPTAARLLETAPNISDPALVAALEECEESSSPSPRDRVQADVDELIRKRQEARRG